MQPFRSHIIPGFKPPLVTAQPQANEHAIPCLVIPLDDIEAVVANRAKAMFFEDGGHTLENAQADERQLFLDMARATLRAEGVEC